MAIVLNDNIRVGAGKPSEPKYLNLSNAPYTGTSQVFSQIPLGERHIGLTALISGSPNVEYWFASGVTNSDLVVKSAGGGSITANNGLTKIGNNIRLGGVLTGNTTINMDQYNLYFEPSNNFQLLGLGTDSNPLSNLEVRVGGSGSQAHIRALEGGSIYLLNLDALSNSVAEIALDTTSVNGIAINAYDGYAAHIRTINSGFTYNHEMKFHNTGVTFSDFRVGSAASGIKYGANYSAGFTARSIPDVAYVTGQTIIAATGATNGLQKIGRNIGWGGPFTTNTNMMGNGWHVNIGQNGGGSNRLGDFRVWAGTAISLDSNTAALMQVLSSSISIAPTSVSLIASTAGQLSLSSSSGLKFIDSRSAKRGLEYQSDYSSGFTKHSIVDKNYVTGLTSTLTGNSVTVNNGLTKIGNNIRLGGTLTGDTLINTTSGCSFYIDSNSFEGGNQIELKIYEGSVTDYSNLVLNGDVTFLQAVTNGLNTRGSVNLSTINSKLEFTTSATTANITFNQNEGRIHYEDVNSEQNLVVDAIGFEFSSTSTGFTGARYDQDYSANYGPRSIPDVAFVTGITSTLNSVNGINITGSSYTATTSSEFIAVSATTAVQVYLPVTPKPYQRIIVKDSKGNGLTVNTTIDGNGNLIDGASTSLINTNYGCVMLIYNTIEWSVVGFA